MIFYFGVAGLLALLTVMVLLTKLPPPPKDSEQTDSAHRHKD